MLLDHTLDNPVGQVRVESHLRYFPGFCSRGSTGIEILFNNPDKLQILRVGARHRLGNLSHAAAITAVISVSRRQLGRPDTQHRNGHADRGNDVEDTHGFVDTQL